MQSQPASQRSKKDVRFSRWSMTVFENQYPLLDIMPSQFQRWGWQDEVSPTTGRKHRQGFIQTKQLRPRQIVKILPGVHIEAIPLGAKGPNGKDRWQALQAYCNKLETRDISGSYVEETQPSPEWDTETTMYQLAVHHWEPPTEDEVRTYKGDTRKYYKHEYWHCVRQVLSQWPHKARHFTDPKIEKFWINTRQVWIARCLGPSYELNSIE